LVRFTQLRQNWAGPSFKTKAGRHFTTLVEV